MNRPSGEKVDVLVIGGGMAGAAAAASAAQAGLKTCLARQGWGATALSSGALDLVDVPAWLNWIFGPACQAEQLTAAAVADFQSWMEQVGYPFDGQPFGELVLLNALWTLKRTQLAPTSIQAGDLKAAAGARILLTGFLGCTSVQAAHLARSLDFFVQQGWLPQLLVEYIEIPFPGVKRPSGLDSFDLAQLFDEPQTVLDLVSQLRQKVSLEGFSHLGFPPVLGLHQPLAAQALLQNETGLACFEILSAPPSVPGFRLQRALDRVLMQAGVRVLQAQVLDFTAEQGRITEVLLGWKEGRYRLSPKMVILASGKFIGGGIERTYRLRETSFDLPVFVNGHSDTSTGLESLLNQRFTSDQPVFSAGLRLDRRLHPLSPDGEVIYHNLAAAGSLASGCDVSQGNGGLGLPLVSGYISGQMAAEQIYAGEWA
jgi:glycerol-3-phosphate dehydrogenase subunit B